MTVTIVGAGFGLYGYLPALLRLKRDVVLPEKYRERLERRTELSALVQAVQWAPEPEDAFRIAEEVVIATPPAVQEALVADLILRHPHITQFFLEKPLAPSPAAAARLISELQLCGKDLCIGYLFLQTAWWRRLQAHEGSGEILLQWSFRAHHFERQLATWKRRHDDGGGVLRFYGVHLFALLTSLGYAEVVESALQLNASGEASAWSATFCGDNLPGFRVAVDSDCAVRRFRIRAGETTLVDIADPLHHTSADTFTLDSRVTPLASLLRNCGGTYPFYLQVNELWARAEQRAAFAPT